MDEEKRGGRRTSWSRGRSQNRWPHRVMYTSPSQMGFKHALHVCWKCAMAGQDTRARASLTLGGDLFSFDSSPAVTPSTAGAAGQLEETSGVYESEKIFWVHFDTFCRLSTRLSYLFTALSVRRTFLREKSGAPFQLPGCPWKFTTNTRDLTVVARRSPSAVRGVNTRVRILRVKVRTAGRRAGDAGPAGGGERRGGGGQPTVIV